MLFSPAAVISCPTVHDGWTMIAISARFHQEQRQVTRFRACLPRERLIVQDGIHGARLVLELLNLELVTDCQVPENVHFATVHDRRGRGYQAGTGDRESIHDDSGTAVSGAGVVPGPCDVRDDVIPACRLADVGTVRIQRVVAVDLYGIEQD